MNKEMEENYFESTSDFELLSSVKGRSTSYRIFNARQDNGLVVYIPGFGADLGDYTDKFAQRITEEYSSYSAMSVEYFCMRSRPSVGAKVRFEETDIQLLTRLFGNELPKEKNQKELVDCITRVSKKNPNIKYDVTASLVPPNGDYQNFGLIAAIDILNAVKHACDKYKLDSNNIVLIGSSYGGYIANLATKIAPGYFRAVFDNSSWSQPNLAYLVGREILRAEMVLRASHNVNIHLFVNSPWTLVEGLPNSFTGSRIGIREFCEKDIIYMKGMGGNKTFYYFSHAVKDEVADTKQKVDMANKMIENGFSVKLNIISNDDVDGVVFKSVRHGMDASMINFFKLAMAELKSLEEKPFKSILPEKTSYKYEDGVEYCFNLVSSPVTGQVKY